MNIADHAITAAASPALIMSDAAPGTISFGELHARSQRVAAVLHEAGLRRGDGVALVLPNRPEFFEITWGCQLSGLYYTAVNTHFTPDEVAYVIDDSDAKVVFIDASMGELAAHVRDVNSGVHVHLAVGGSLPGWRSYDDVLTAAGGAPPQSDGSEMLYSSGTTGRPKGGPPSAAGRRQRLMGVSRCWRWRWFTATGWTRRACTSPPRRCITPPG